MDVLKNRCDWIKYFMRNLFEIYENMPSEDISIFTLLHINSKGVPFKKSEGIGHVHVLFYASNSTVK